MKSEEGHMVIPSTAKDMITVLVRYMNISYHELASHTGLAEKTLMRIEKGRKPKKSSNNLITQFYIKQCTFSVENRGDENETA